MSPADAEVIGLQALAWLAGNEDLWPVFLNASGASAAEVRDSLGDPAVQAAAVEFLLLDDRTVIDFCRDHDLPPTALADARRALPGGEAVHWT